MLYSSFCFYVIERSESGDGSGVHGSVYYGPVIGLCLLVVVIITVLKIKFKALNCLIVDAKSNCNNIEKKDSEYTKKEVLYIDEHTSFSYTSTINVQLRYIIFIYWWAYFFSYTSTINLQLRYIIFIYWWAYFFSYTSTINVQLRYIIFIYWWAYFFSYTSTDEHTSFHIPQPLMFNSGI